MLVKRRFILAYNYVVKENMRNCTPIRGKTLYIVIFYT